MSDIGWLKTSLAEAVKRLPGPQQESVVTLFEHGSLVVKLYAPRGRDSQTAHSRDEVYVIAGGAGEFVCGWPAELCPPRHIVCSGRR